MKNIFTIFAVFFTAILSSCSNDDITILESTTFKINPASVVQPFTYEVNPGDLEGVSSGNSLRIRLLVYNSNGELSETETQYLSSYASLMSTSMNLAYGDYTAVVVTDVVERNGNEIKFSCWELSDENSISTAKITDKGYIGGKSKILGIGSTKFSVSGTSKDVSINPTPAGSVLCVMFKHIHQFSDVETLTLETNRSCDYLVFNKDGGYDIAVENDNNKYNWRAAYINPSSHPNSTNIYGYYFVFPINNISYRFRIDIDGSDSLNTDAMSFNLKAGAEYYFVLDLCDPDYNDGITYNGFEIKDSRSSGDAIQDKQLNRESTKLVEDNTILISTLIQ